MAVRRGSRTRRPRPQPSRRAPSPPGKPTRRPTSIRRRTSRGGPCRLRCGRRAPLPTAAQAGSPSRDGDRGGAAHGCESPAEGSNGLVPVRPEVDAEGFRSLRSCSDALAATRAPDCGDPHDDPRGLRCFERYRRSTRAPRGDRGRTLRSAGAADRRCPGGREEGLRERPSGPGGTGVDRPGRSNLVVALSPLSDPGLPSADRPRRVGAHALGPAARTLRAEPLRSLGGRRDRSSPSGRRRAGRRVALVAGFHLLAPLPRGSAIFQRVVGRGGIAGCSHVQVCYANATLMLQN